MLDEGGRIGGLVSAAVPGGAKRVGLHAVDLLGVESVALELGEAAAGISQWDRQVDHVLLVEKQRLSGRAVQHSAIGELDLLAWVLPASHDEQRPLSREQRSFGNPGRTVGCPDRYEGRSSEDQRSYGRSRFGPVGHALRLWGRSCGLFCHKNAGHNRT